MIFSRTGFFTSVVFTAPQEKKAFGRRTHVKSSTFFANEIFEGAGGLVFLCTKSLCPTSPSTSRAVGEYHAQLQASHANQFAAHLALNDSAAIQTIHKALPNKEFHKHSPPSSGGTQTLDCS